MARVSIIIVNWNGLRHLKTCLDSALKQTYTDFEVVLVDNGSIDESVNFVRTNYPTVTIIECEDNHGFAEGNNIGIRETLKNPEVKYIVCLNNDTEVKEDWLEKLVEAVEDDDRIGACASKLLYFDDRNIIDSAGDFYLQGSLKVIPRGHGQPDQYFEQAECLSCCAAAALYRRQALEETKLGEDYFDTDYFAYIEDTDLSLRIRIAGWKCQFVPDAVVYHKVSATTSQLKAGTKKFYSGRNRILTAMKILPWFQWFRAIKNPGTASSQEHKLGWFRSMIVYTRILGSVVLLLPALLKKRRIIKSSNKLGSDALSKWQSKFSIEK